MKKIAVLFLGLAMGIANVGIPAAHAGTTATLSLSPTNTSVETGDSFSLSVLVDANDESLDTVRVDLSFDPDMVEVLSFDLGSLFPNLSPSNDIDNDAGTLSYGAYKFGTPVTSSGTLATVTFHALSSGTATIAVEDSSRLISDGEETIDTGELGSSRITITGADVESEAPATTDEEDTSSSNSNGASESDQAAALVYFGALFGRLPSSDDDWETNNCIADDGCYDSDNRNLTYEVAALAKFNSKYGANPSSSMDWQAVHALAYTTAGQELLGLEPLEEGETTTEEETTEEETTTESSASLEAQALVYFGAFYARMPSSEDDWAALHCIAYGGCEEDEQDLAAEQAALVTFGAKYGKMPSTDMEWNVIHTLAYTDFLDSGEEEEVAEVDEVEEVVEEETSASLEQQALVYFGAFYARMPSSEDDWAALHCIAYGGCEEEEQDLAAEQAALVIFGAKYAKMPSTDMEWNVVHTLAYTDFLESGDEEEVDEVAEVEEVVAEEETALTLEQQAIGWFGTITGRLPSEDADWVAIDYMVNGYTPSDDERDLEAESAAITTYVSAFGALPSSDQDWNIVAAIAYSGAF